MRVPNVHGIIRRRLLVNFRIDPDVAQKQLPSQFRPKLHAGYAVGGICLIRLEGIRPKRFPEILGFSSENAAHRFAVRWDGAGGEQEGVYIPRRDSGSLLNSMAGGRLFPGEQHRARFTVTDDGNRVELAMTSADRAVSVHVAGASADALSPQSIFSSIKEASDFFEAGSLGYSATSSGRRLDGIVLCAQNWEVHPLGMESVQSSYFDDRSLFPSESIRFDHALIMRNIEHEWLSASAMSV
ncbi:MAG: hypothetical protein QOK37_31 [Thermoanaerobaculia bacterium]|jgi:hypothetical protein|nr:hypothetical protein [Thermoanaerobaculia bacterium]